MKALQFHPIIFVFVANGYTHIVERVTKLDVKKDGRVIDIEGDLWNTSGFKRENITMSCNISKEEVVDFIAFEANKQTKIITAFKTKEYGFIPLSIACEEALQDYKYCKTEKITEENNTVYNLMMRNTQFRDELKYNKFTTIIETVRHKNVSLYKTLYNHANFIYIKNRNTLFQVFVGKYFVSDDYFIKNKDFIFEEEIYNPEDRFLNILSKRELDSLQINNLL